MKTTVSAHPEVCEAADDASRSDKPRARRVRVLNEEQRDRRHRILSIVRDLLTDRGAAGVTVREVAHRSGVSLKTLYDIYGSKDELLVAAVRERVNAVFTRAEEKAGGLKGVPRLLHYIDLHSEGVRATPAFSRAVAPLLAGPVDRFGSEEVFSRFHSAALADVREAGDLRADADPARVAEVLLLTMLGTLQIWAREQISADEMCALNRLIAAQTILPLVSGESARAVRAVIDGYYAARPSHP